MAQQPQDNGTQDGGAAGPPRPQPSLRKLLATLQWPQGRQARSLRGPPLSPAARAARMGPCLAGVHGPGTLEPSRCSAGGKSGC